MAQYSSHAPEKAFQHSPCYASSCGTFSGHRKQRGHFLFEKCAELAWIADGEDRTVEQYRIFVAQGFSWAAIAGPGRCVGFLCSTIKDADLHIWELVTLRDEQRPGIGGLLVATALSAAIAHGIWNVTLTFREVRRNAPFYERLGFEIIRGEQFQSAFVVR